MASIATNPAGSSTSSANSFLLRRVQPAMTGLIDGSLGSGLLTGNMTRGRVAALSDDDWRKDDARFREPQLSRHLALVQRLQTVADRYDTTPGAVAIAWTLRNPAVDGAIVGFRRPDQVDPILVAASLELTDEDLNDIEGRH